MIRLAASIYLLSQTEGGASRDGFSGMRPSFGFGQELITSEISTPAAPGAILPRGHWSKVEIRLPYGEIFGNAIRPGIDFAIQLGGWRVGYGKVEEIIEVFHDPKNADLLGDESRHE